jgi:hypothetical protein
MATRVSKQSVQGKAGVLGGAANRGAVDDGTVFASMKEFWYWVAIVTLLIFLLFIMTLGLVYLDKRIKKAEAILIRAEQMEKKKHKLEPEE